jgi:hypothetical protein
MSYKNLEIWQESRTLVVDIHKMTLQKLNNFIKSIERDISKNK